MNQDAPSFSPAELEAYLDEALHPERTAEIEAALRDNKSLVKQLSQINGRRDAGVHTLGEIWRRNHLGVPTREELGSYLLGVLPDEHRDYIDFRLKVLKCPFTRASLRDLEAQQQEAESQRSQRRRKYYHSTAGLLKGKRREE